MVWLHGLNKKFRLILSAAAIKTWSDRYSLINDDSFVYSRRHVVNETVVMLVGAGVVIILL